MPDVQFHGFFKTKFMNLMFLLFRKKSREITLSSFLLALRLRMMKKMILGPFSKFYMFRAKFYCIKEDDIDSNLEWLLTKKGQSFLFGDSSTKNNWTFGQKTSNMVGEVRGDFSMDPLAYISNYYR